MYTAMNTIEQRTYKTGSDVWKKNLYLMILLDWGTADLIG